MREPGRKRRKSKEDAGGVLAPRTGGKGTTGLTLIVPRNYGHFRLIGVMRR